jgi:ERF superfamily
VNSEAQIFDLLEKLQKKIDLIYSIQQSKPQGDRKELYTALAAAQAEFRIARAHKENHYFRMKYEDLADVIIASRPYLAKNGLSVTFPVNSTDDGGTVLSCILLHSSGQEIESKVRLLPAKNDPKSFSSEMSFMKRILYSGITGVVADDEDDDADLAMSGPRDVEARGVALNAKPEPREDKTPITKEQYEELEYELAEYPEITQQILDGLKIRELANMPKAKYSEAIRRVRYIKDLRNNKR